MFDFLTHLFDREKNREEGKVEGESAKSVGSPDQKLFDVLKPILTVYEWPDTVETGPVDAEFKQVRVTADKALLDQTQGTVSLSGNVVSEGEDFRITTESVTYERKTRLLTSDDFVRITRFSGGGGEEGTSAMVLSGTGLEVDMAVRSMSIRRDVEAKLFGVGDDFLAAGNGNANGGTAGTSVENVTITASGKMSYSHVGQLVEFRDNVKAVSGERVLTCDDLKILLGEGSDPQSMEVNEIVAVGRVELTHEGQTARGDVLKWGNVTQTGTLTGSPASVTSDEFDMRGEKLTFYRLNERFNCQGSGNLLWKAGAQPPEQQLEVKHAEQARAWDVGPLSMSGEGPIRVEWNTTMTYQVDAGVASFEGGVKARQAGSSLDCELLTLRFNSETKAMETVTAEGDVKVHDAQAAGARDVVCHKLVWNAVDNTVELHAREGDVVTVKAGPNTIQSGQVKLDNPRELLECPVQGRLTVEPASKQPAGEDAEQTAPIAVTWTEAMSFTERPKPLARFRGSVFARRGQQSIEGDQLELAFDEQSNPLQMTVTGGAAIDVESAKQAAPPTEGTAEAPSLAALGTGAAGHWRFAAKTLTILIPEEQIRTQTPGLLTVTEGDTTNAAIAWQSAAHLDWGANGAEFSGNVDSTMPGTNLKCQKLTLEFDDLRQLRNIWAEGGIEFEQKQRDSWHLTSSSAQAVFAGESRLRQVIALDDVNVRSETHTLKTDSLQLFLEEIEGSTDPQVVRAVAQGDVRVLYEANRDDPVKAGGDRLEWERRRDVYLLVGKPDAYVQHAGVKLSSDKMEVDRQTGTMKALPDARPVTTEFMVPLR